LIDWFACKDKANEDLQVLNLSFDGHKGSKGGMSYQTTMIYPQCDDLLIVAVEMLRLGKCHPERNSAKSN
jgi:hypothetical protein